MTGNSFVDAKRMFKHACAFADCAVFCFKFVCLYVSEATVFDAAIHYTAVSKQQDALDSHGNVMFKATHACRRQGWLYTWRTGDRCIQLRSRAKHRPHLSSARSPVRQKCNDLMKQIMGKIEINVSGKFSTFL